MLPLADRVSSPAGGRAKVRIGRHRHSARVDGAAAARVDLPQPAVESEQPQRVAFGDDAELRVRGRHDSAVAAVAGSTSEAPPVPITHTAPSAICTDTD
jgi:hypothetical protein